MIRALVLVAALGVPASAHAQAAQTQQPRAQPPPPPAPPPDNVEPAPQEAPPPEEAPPPQQYPDQQQPPPPDQAPPANTEDLRRMHLAFGVSGVALLGGGDVNLGLSGEVGAKLIFGDHFNIRLFANYTYINTANSTDHLLFLSAEPTLSFGFYSAGVGVLLGAADLDPGGIGALVGGFVAPVKLKFGTNITAEVSLDLGAALLTSRPGGGVSPFGRITFNIFL